MFSIYIPRLLNEHTVQTVANVMAHYKIGIVQYVDFTPVDKKPGFYENHSQDSKYKSAFVHFLEVPGFTYNMHIWDAILNTNNTNNNSNMNADVKSNGNTDGNPNRHSYRLQITPQEYWICCKNNAPVLRTMMNIHQVCENARYLEDRIAKLEQAFATIQDLLAIKSALENNDKQTQQQIEFTLNARVLTANTDSTLNTH